MLVHGCVHMYECAVSECCVCVYECAVCACVNICVCVCLRAPGSHTGGSEGAVNPKWLRRAISLGGSTIRAEGSPRALWVRAGMNQRQQPGRGESRLGQGRGLRKEVATASGSIRAKEHRWDFIAGTPAGRPSCCGISRFDQSWWPLLWREQGGEVWVGRGSVRLSGP